MTKGLAKVQAFWYNVKKLKTKMSAEKETNHVYEIAQEAEKGVEDFFSVELVRNLLKTKLASLEAARDKKTLRAGQEHENLKRLTRRMYRQMLKSKLIRYPERNLIPDAERTLKPENQDVERLERLARNRDEMSAIAYEDTKEDLISVMVEKYAAYGQNKIIEMKAVTDKLTGLNKREYLEHLIVDILSDRNIHDRIEKKNDDIHGALLMIDVDYFKSVNDALGHKSGDNALQAFAKFLRDAFREDDYVARWGGEEFSVFLPEIDRSDRKKIDPMKNLKSVLKRVYSLAKKFTYTDEYGVERKLTFSIGARIFDYREVISRYEDAEGIPGKINQKRMFENIGTLSKASDKALYDAKEKGRNCAYLATGSGEKIRTKSLLKGTRKVVRTTKEEAEQTPVKSPKPKKKPALKKQSTPQEKPTPRPRKKAKPSARHRPKSGSRGRRPAGKK